MKKPVGKRSLQKTPEPPLRDGSITVAITRKYSVAPYETADFHVSVTGSPEPGETQREATARLYQQLKADAAEMAREVRMLAKSNTI